MPHVLKAVSSVSPFLLVSTLLSAATTLQPLTVVQTAGGYDAGQATLFRGLADVNGDGRADYCRFTGTAPNLILSCGLGKSDGTFGTADVNSAAGLLPGEAGKFRGMADVNGDKRADYCRIIEEAGTSKLSCALATENGSFIDGTHTVAHQEESSLLFSALADIDGDGRADFCSLAGTPSGTISCRFALTNGTFASTTIKTNGIRPGQPALFRGLADVNGDGRADFCRFTGNGTKLTLSCGLSKGNGTFDDANFLSVQNFDPGTAEFRGLTDTNGDGRADYCRLTGNGDDARIFCTLSRRTDFSGRVEYARGAEEPTVAFRGMADVNGDGQSDVVRIIGTGTTTVISAAVPSLVRVIDTIPATLSGETNQDSEPFLAISPANSNRMAVSAFTPNPAGVNAATAPIYVTSDGGDTWRLNAIVPSQSKTGDITHAFNPTGALYGGILKKPGSLILNSLVATDFLASTVMQVQASREQIDQPYVQTKRRTDNNIYVGLNDLGNKPKTATLDFSRDGGQTFTTVRLEDRKTPGQNAPSIRPAVANDNTVYVAFFGWRTFDGIQATSDVVVLRDDNGGADEFRSLKDDDELRGKRVVKEVQIPWSPGPTLGQERIGSTLALAVDPNQSSVVWVAWADGTGDDLYTLHVRHSTDRGAMWSEDVRTIANATNAALAVGANGTVGLLYQQVTGNEPTDRWVTKLEITSDAFATHHDLVLADTTAREPEWKGLPYLGDYANLIADGRSFHGVFAASNIPDPANFPNGVTFQREVDFGRRMLLNGAGVRVDPSIDTFYFRVAQTQ